MAIRSFRELDAWKLAHELTLEIYKVVRRLPEEERFCLSLQMRRAAISIGANIAEGFVRFGPKEQCRFFNISRGSAEELRYFLILAKDLNYLPEFAALEAKVDRVSAMLHRMMQIAAARSGRSP